MKNQLPPPCFVTAVPVTCARFQLSYVQCTVLALQDPPVSAEDPPAVTMQTRSFSAEMAEQARATAELVRSATMSTPSLSYQPRRIPTPTSGLFWWSAAITSTFMLGLAAMNSAAACFAQATPFGPLMSRYGPERSVSTPTLMIGVSARARRIRPLAIPATAPPISTALRVTLITPPSDYWAELLPGPMRGASGGQPPSQNG